MKLVPKCGSNYEMRRLQSVPDNECDVWKTTPVGLDRFMQDSTGPNQLGAWCERGDMAGKIHAGDHGELETGSHPEWLPSDGCTHDWSQKYIDWSFISAERDSTHII